MPIRLRRRSGCPVTEWPCTTIFAVVAAVVDELVPDPQQIVFLLASQRDPRPDPRVHEGVVSFDVGECEPFEEGPVRGRKDARERFVYRREQGCIPRSGRERDAVAQQGRLSAHAEPLRGAAGAVEEGEQQGVMVSLEEHALEARRGKAEQEVDHLARLKPAIHVVSEEDQHPPFGGGALGVFPDLPEQAGERPELAVDVAYRVHARPGRDGGGRRLRPPARPWTAEEARDHGCDVAGR